MTEVRVETQFGSAFLRCNFGTPVLPTQNKDILNVYPRLAGCCVAGISGGLRKDRYLKCEFGFLPEPHVEISSDSAQMLDAFLFESDAGHGHYGIRDDEWFDHQGFTFVDMTDRPLGREYMFRVMENCQVIIPICAAWSFEKFDAMNLESWMAVDAALTWQ